MATRCPARGASDSLDEALGGAEGIHLNEGEVCSDVPRGCAIAVNTTGRSRPKSLGGASGGVVHSLDLRLNREEGQG